MIQGYVWAQSTRSVVPAGEATVPFAVPGVLFGETLFETMRARRGTFFTMAAHIERLQSAIEGLQWGTPMSAAVIKAGLQALLRTDNLAREDELRVRITVLRLHDDGRLECFIHALRYEPPQPARYAEGVDAVVTSLRVDAAAPWANFKIGQRFAHRLAKLEAERTGAWEGILLNTDGMLVDGTIANLHFVVKGRILTPSHRCGALPGVTQRVIRDIALEKQVPWEFGTYAPTMLKQATEAFLTNAMIGVMPLVRVDGLPLGEGKPGPVTRCMATAYAARVAQESRPVDD